MSSIPCLNPLFGRLLTLYGARTLSVRRCSISVENWPLLDDLGAIPWATNGANGFRLAFEDKSSLLTASRPLCF